MFYSATENKWFPPEFRADYEANGAWPADAVEHPREVYDATVSNRPVEKVMMPDSNGAPTLVDSPQPPPLTLGQVHAQRQAAYVAESDPLKNEADYDALVGGLQPDYVAWQAKVAEIKERYPLPAAE